MSTFPGLPDLAACGHDLHRPECVVATRSGDVFVPDWRGGVTVVRATGAQQTWLARDSPVALRPNALALLPDDGFLLANLGDEGGVWRLNLDGTVAPFLTTVDGRELPPVNFVTRDTSGRVWISVSTSRHPRQEAWRPDVADGFIVVVDGRGARIVAEGLHYTNEVRLDAVGRWLYAVETFGRRLIRFLVSADGSLGPRETVATFGRGTFPDGFAFDESGGIWVTSLVSNRILRITPSGQTETLLEDANPAFVNAAEDAFVTGVMGRQHLGPIPGTRFQQLTSVAFGGPDRRTGWIGSLHASCLYSFRAPVAGAMPVHWDIAGP